jgi:hypothetical protein
MAERRTLDRATVAVWIRTRVTASGDCRSLAIVAIRHPLASGDIDAQLAIVPLAGNG